MKIYLVRAVCVVGDQPCFFDAFFITESKARETYNALWAHWQNDGGVIEVTHDRGMFSVDGEAIHGVSMMEMQQPSQAIDPGFFR